MNSKMRLNALMLAALAMGGNNFMASGSGDEMTVYLPKEPIPPSGTKTYFFNAIGEFSTESMLKEECVFKCFAINYKNAKRKFDKWQKVNSEKRCKEIGV